jgi:SAM-dependent methyltransferase
VSEIENRIEANRPDMDYAELEFGDDEVAGGAHRVHVGRRWDAIGQLQLDFLRAQGLRPSDRFLDVGCGAFRAGSKLVEYLEPAHYYGIDINHDVIKAGYEHELDEAGRARLPTSNLRATDRFDCDFGVTFDVAIAQSVFTHVNLNRIRLCLHRVAKVVRPGGTFFVTFNEFGPKFPIDGTRGGKYTERNVFWYYRRDIKWAARQTPWTFEYVGDWGHPRGQKMVRLTRKSD